MNTLKLYHHLPRLVRSLRVTEIDLELRCRKSCRSSSNMGKRQRGPELKHSTLEAMRVRHMDVRCEYQTQDNSC